MYTEMNTRWIISMSTINLLSVARTFVRALNLKIEKNQIATTPLRDMWMSIFSALNTMILNERCRRRWRLHGVSKIERKKTHTHTQQQFCISNQTETLTTATATNFLLYSNCWLQKRGRNEQVSVYFRSSFRYQLLPQTINKRLLSLSVCMFVSILQNLL